MADRSGSARDDIGDELDPGLVVAVAEAIALDMGDCSALAGQTQMSSCWNVYRGWAIVAIRAAEEYEAERADG